MTKEDQYSEAVLLLREAEIEPDNVCAFGVTAQGYFEFQRDAYGRIIYDPATHNGRKEWRQWPNQQIGSAIYLALNPST